MSINGTRWKIGWRPKFVILASLIGGGIMGALVDAPGVLAFIGLLVGVAVWFWGRSEVNSKYLSLLEDFRDTSRSQIERETGGMEVSSAHTFISASGSSPMLIDPAPTYRTSHLLFGDTSVVVNRQYKYDMKERTQLKGGKQQEVFYDQISNVQSEDYNNYAELEISLSSGDTERIRGRDTSGINEVKSDLQQKMREARRGTRMTQESKTSASPQRGAGTASTQTATGAASTRTEAERSGRTRDQSGTTRSGEPTPDATSHEAAPTAAESETGPVSTDWLTGASAEATLHVRNDASRPQSVRVGCRVEGETRLADDVRLAPDETADWDDLPDDSRFEIGVVVEGGPTAGERFDPERDPPGEIRVSITDSDVVFGDWDDSDSNDSGWGDSEPSHDDAGSRDETTAEPHNETTQRDGLAGTPGAASSTTSQSAEDAAGTAEPSGIASKVFGESESSSGGAASEGGAPSGSGATSAHEANESWESAAELATAVQQSASRERVERLTSFLDASSASERRSAIRGIRQSVRKHPEPIAASVPSISSLLTDDVGETRQEATVTLQRLAESHPNAVADVTDAVVERLGDENPKVRIAACRILDEIGAVAGAEKLEELADEDRHKGVQVAAFHALQSIDR